MFSRIGCPQFEHISTLVKVFEKLGKSWPDLDNLARHLNYLGEQGILFDPPSSPTGLLLSLLEADSDFQVLKNIEPPIEKLLKEKLQETGIDELVNKPLITPDEFEYLLNNIEPAVVPMFIALQLLVRQISVRLRVIDGMGAYPILSQVVPQMPTQQTEKHEVIDVVIKTLPIPDETTSWEQIIEYRNDADARSKFLALRNWMSEVARAKLTPVEIEEKLEYLIDQYQ